MNTFYFTWGTDHPMGGYVQRIDAPTESRARGLMFRYYGQRWCACLQLGKSNYEIGDRLVRLGPCTYVRLDKVIVADEYDADNEYVEDMPHKRNREACA